MWYPFQAQSVYEAIRLWIETYWYKSAGYQYVDEQSGRFKLTAIKSYSYYWDDTSYKWRVKFGDIVEGTAIYQIQKMNDGLYRIEWLSPPEKRINTKC